MRNLSSMAVPAAILLSLFTLPGKAALVGTSVTGSLTFTGDPSNYFDPGYGFVPATGYLNTSSTTVTISNSAVEFGFDDGDDLISADFTDNQLTISDLAESPLANNPFQMTFSDSAFAGQSLSAISDSFVDYSLVGDLLTLNYGGGTPIVGQTLTASFNITPTPEPSSAGIVSVSALLALTFCVVRKRHRAVEPTPAH